MITVAQGQMITVMPQMTQSRRMPPVPPVLAILAMLVALAMPTVALMVIVAASVLDLHVAHIAGKLDDRDNASKIEEAVASKASNAPKAAPPAVAPKRRVGRASDAAGLAAPAHVKLEKQERAQHRPKDHLAEDVPAQEEAEEASEASGHTGQGLLRLLHANPVRKHAYQTRFHGFSFQPGCVWRVPDVRDVRCLEPM